MTGLITKGIGGFYYVLTDEGIIEAKGRGIFKKDGITLAVGDVVELEKTEDGKGVINSIYPRKNQSADCQCGYLSGGFRACPSEAELHADR